MRALNHEQALAAIHKLADTKFADASILVAIRDTAAEALKENANAGSETAVTTKGPDRRS